MPTRMADSKFHSIIPSDFRSMREVQGELISAVEAHRFDNDAVFAIKLALEEALINAIKHGNKLDANKKVTIDAMITNDRAEFVIQDQGEGFRRKDVPDPTDDHNREKSSGRGLLLIEAYMTDVSYSDRGRRLKMVYKKKA
jgi:serine/threonine-protein kinase RsbW